MKPILQLQSKHIVLAGFVGLIAGGSSCNSSLKKSTTSDTPPNILIIMADDMGYNDIGCYGSEAIKTPNLDKMAAEGLLFTDYHSNGAVSSPTRAALITGNYQQRSGVEGVITAVRYRDYGLDINAYTIADYFKENGYATGITGKWHLGYKTDFNPTNFGFDFFKGYVSGNVDFHSHIDGAGIYDWWLNKDTIIEEGYSTDLITKNSIDFIEKNSDHPFFLYIAHEAPHYPYQGRNDKADRTIDGEFEMKGSRKDKKGAYKEMVEVMDEGIGMVIASLEEQGILENTFVFFCSDNGAVSLGSNYPLNNFKGSLWEGGHRVPAIAYWKNKIQPGTTDELMLGMDIFPTVAGIIAKSDPDIPKLDGIDLTPAILHGEQMKERAVFWRYKDRKAVRQGDWKLLIDNDNTYLFNLADDLSEQNNLILDKKEISDNLKKLLQDWESEMNQYDKNVH